MTSPIDPRHLSEPGLAVLDITAADEDTAHALMDGLQQLWATSGITPTRREPGQPGVHARIHAHIHTQAPQDPLALPSKGTGIDTTKDDHAY
ncbi:hypothetical protein YUYDRAFT_07088 [Streptomyces sp. ScaeMP-e48]|uniref:DUF6207 family protein n=1 Tax=Streptomyces sp. ScaeMP-e48 TaxID=1100823 RepID=UPI000823AD59|nr:DUF6207 family protein [Streptomyces sp. ScaeMP-e48]SCK54074.1 hypothetical protein YUYDRAFT_07088 [Streptomyces sp. ScaeMP-e48]